MRSKYKQGKLCGINPNLVGRSGCLVKSRLAVCFSVHRSGVHDPNRLKISMILLNIVSILALVTHYIVL